MCNVAHPWFIRLTRFHTVAKNRQKITGGIGENGSGTLGSNNDPENIKGHCRSTGSTRNRSDRTIEECKEQGRGHPQMPPLHEALVEVHKEYA